MSQYAFVSNGEVQFTKDLIHVFGESLPVIDKYIVVDWINCLIRHYDEKDAEFMREIYMAGDSGHKNYYQLFK